MYDQKLIDAIQKAWHAYIADSENLPADLLNMDKKPSIIQLTSKYSIIYQ